MDFHVLGPVRLWNDGEQVDPGPAKQRCVLAVLLVGLNHPHGVESLIDRVWGEEPPAQARTALYSYVSRLRRVFRDAGFADAQLMLRQRAGGYALELPAESVDLHRFEAATHRAHAVEDVAGRAELLREALGQWSGPPLQDLPGRWAEEVRQSLRRRRVRVAAECAQLLLDQEQHAEAGDLLEREITQNPLAEPLVGRLMLSLRAQDRQPEALHCYATFRRQLVDELGVEPGPALRDLHLGILREDTPSALPLDLEPHRTPAAEPAETAVRQLTRPPVAVPPPRAGQGPYLGMETFQPEDSAWFFGRQALLDELLSRLPGHRFLAVFGPSGSGKSSLLRAGLVATIQTGEVAAYANWTPVLCTPGEHPLQELAVRLAAATGLSAAALHRDLSTDPAGLGLLVRQAACGDDRDSAILLLIDQFEEIFTLCDDPRERAGFLEALLSVVDSVSVPGRVVIGVRADFYASCAEFPELIGLLRDQQFLVGPMTEAELREVIVEPATRAGLTVEPALVDAVLADVLGEPSALPLLSHALLETWRRRDGGVLTLARYRLAGGVRGAIAQTADQVFERFDTGRKRLAREVFLRLTVPGEGPEDTRRRARRGELVDRADAPEMSSVVAELAEARLITLDEETVTVTHECLIRGWPRLRDWIDDDRERLRAHRRLTETARDWEAQARDEALLYRGSALTAWKDRGFEQLNDLEREFLTAGTRHQDRERRDRRRRVRTLLMSMSVALVGLLALATVAFVQTARARQERDRAFADRLVTSARAMLSTDPELSVLLAGRALEIHPDDQAESALAQSLAESKVRVAWQTGQGQSIGVDFSQDGRLVASAGNDHTVRIRPVDGNGEPIILRGHDDRVLDVAFSPDGTRVASASQDGTVRVWNSDGTGVPVVLRGSGSYLNAVSWRPDGRVLAVAAENGEVIVRNADGTGTPTVLKGHTKRVLTVAFSPDGTRIASGSGDRTIRVWDPATGRTVTTLTGHGDSVEDLAYGPGGRQIVSGGTDGTTRIWAADGTGSPVVLADHQGTVETVAFSHDGRHVISGGNDRTARIRQADGQGDPVVLRGSGGPIWSVSFSPDDRLVATAGDDGVVRLWDPAAKPDQRVLPGGNGAVWKIAISPDGSLVAAACDDGTVRVQRADGSGTPILLTGHRGAALAVAFSQDGLRVASAGDDGTVRIWPLAGNAPPKVLTGHKSSVFGVAFSPDGRQVVSGGNDGTVRIRPADGDGPPIILHTGAGIARDVAFSPDGGRVASANYHGTVTVWRLPAPGDPVVLPVGHDGLVWSVAFSPDGDSVAGADNDGSLRVWHAAGDPAPAVMTGHDGLAWSVAFSRDGRWLASAGNDHTVRVWRRTPGPPLVVLSGSGATFESVTFGTGDLLAASRDNGTVETWRCEVCVSREQLEALARHRLTRDFTDAERQLYLTVPA